MSFIDHFAMIEDPRSHINMKHDFLDILFLTVSAVMSGAEAGKISRSLVMRSWLGCVNIGHSVMGCRWMTRLRGWYGR